MRLSWDIKPQFQCAQTKSCGQCNFLYDSYGITKHTSVQTFLLTQSILNQKFKKSRFGRVYAVKKGNLSYPKMSVQVMHAILASFSL